MYMKKLIILLLLTSSCSSQKEDNTNIHNSNILLATYLDPHLHSPRSSDFGTYGISNNSIETITQAAISAGIDWIWFTDHPGPMYLPFDSTSSVYDGIEICDPGFMCYNEVVFDGKPYRLVVAPFEITLNPAPFNIDAVEVIATGGSFQTDQERDGINYGIQSIQAGYKPHFMGASNSHAGLPGANGLTAILKENSKENSLRKGRMTAVRSKEYTYFLYQNETGLKFIRPAISNYELYVVEVHPDRIVTTQTQQIKEISKNCMATFSYIRYNGKIVAVTSPIYN